MKRPRPALSTFFTNGLFDRLPNDEMRQGIMTLLGDMVELWDYKQGLLDQCHARGYTEVLVHDDDVLEISTCSD
ncbi:hypothetical protein BRADI_4g13320v3 [Brachypodium distachyon]|uniref:Uncharacterized protein n=1 Tax=Brachypodium distachyon TaxID=15368 RepID=I1IK95_BRADI|nr:hypothetical protein BRADI_4g13320v3 [Brachypodium distachyon]